MRLLMIALVLCIVAPSLAGPSVYTLDDGGALRPIPLRPLTKKDKDLIHDSGGERSGLVRGCQIKVYQRETFVYGRTSSDGMIITGGGASTIYNTKQYRYTVVFAEVVDAPAQPHMVGRKGWMVIKKEYLRKTGWHTDETLKTTPPL